VKASFGGEVKELIFHFWVSRQVTQKQTMIHQERKLLYQAAAYVSQIRLLEQNQMNIFFHHTN